jgi:hypothetical protein
MARKPRGGKAAPQDGRRALANPHLGQRLEARLHRAGAIDLRDNYVRESLGNGYSRIVPIDPTIRFRAGKK